MAETHQTGLAGLPSVTLQRRRDVMRHPTVQRCRHALVRPLRGTGEPHSGYLVTGPDGVELGVLVCVDPGRRPAFAVVPAEEAGPPARIEGRHAAAGALAWHVVQQRLRAARDAERAEAEADAAFDRRRMDPFDAEALDRLTLADARTADTATEAPHRA